MNIARALILLIFFSGIIASYLLADNFKETIKSTSVSIYQRVELWSKVYQSYVSVLDEKLLLTQELLAFTNKLVFKEGEPITLNITGNHKITVTVFQIDDFGKKNIRSFNEYELSKSPKAVFSSFDGVISPTDKVTIETNKFSPGWIGIQVEDKEGRVTEIPVFLDYNIELSGIVFVESTDTLLAYNPAYQSHNIPNYYRKNLDKTGSNLVPKNTPITYSQLDSRNIENISCTDHLINSDAIHKQNLASWNIQFMTVSDEALDDINAFENIEYLIFGTHNEYWTADKAVNVMKFIDAGGKVLFLGGNTAWRQVFRETGRTWFHGHSLNNEPEFKTLITKYLGTYYDSGDYDTYAPFNLVNQTAILDIFDINLSDVSNLGEGSRFEHCKSKISGVSGHETDKLVEGAEGFTILAKGLNDKGGADLVYKSFASGGEVLNFGSLSLWHNNDPNLSLLIQRFLKQNRVKEE